MADLCKLAEAEIDRLTKAGVAVTPAEVCRINDMALRVDSPHAALDAARGAPVQVGNVWLWPMTIYAAGFIQDIVPEMPRRLQRAAVAYALAHGRDIGEPGPLDGGPRMAALRVHDWHRNLRCTEGELDLAIAQCLPRAEGDGKKEKQAAPAMTLTELATRLSVATGLPIEHWTRRCSTEHAFAAWHIAMTQANQSGDPMKDSARLRADMALGRYIDTIKRRAQA